MAWYDDLLKKMGAPDSNASATSLQLWAQSEGTPPSWNNWLATTEPGFGGTPVNSAGVQAYPTETDGVDATYATLQGSAYLAVIDAFVSNAGAQIIWDAVNGSPWCAGCENGEYPVALYNYLQGHGGVVPTGGGQTEPTIGPGARGHYVRILQRRLDDLGHRLPVNGVYDQATTDTVKAFQRAHNLTVDGITGPQTWGKLLAVTSSAKQPVGAVGPGGPLPPNEPASNISGKALDAWSNLKTATGSGANAGLARIAGYRDIIRKAGR